MRRQQGFTIVELITVIVLVGVLAAIGVPRLMGENFTTAVVFGDQVASALRLAQKSAVARRRLVCVEITAGTLRLRVRTAPGPAPDNAGAAACDAQLAGVEDGAHDSSDSKVTQNGAPAALYFQPDGSVSGSPAGAPLSMQTIEIRMGDATQRSIRLEGSTGHVE